MTTREILVKARALVERGSSMLDAVDFIESSRLKRNGVYLRLIDALGRDVSLSIWSACERHTRAEVLAAFDKAIQMEGKS